MPIKTLVWVGIIINKGKRIMILKKGDNYRRVKACSITLFNEENILVKRAFVSKVTPSGFTLTFNCRDLVLSQVRDHSFSSENGGLGFLLYRNIRIYIPEMDIDLEGNTVALSSLEAGNFALQIEFLPESPKYWGECLQDLWPVSLI